MRCLVTGGAGFIGSHLAEALVGTHEVTVFDDFSTGKKENLKAFSGKVRVIRGDVRNPKLLSVAMRGVDTVFHQAAVVSVQESLENPRKTYEVNAAGSWNVFQAASEQGVKTVVYASSCSVYGEGSKKALGESAPLNPLSFYADSKRAVEAQASLFYRIRGLRAVGLRYFNVFGPRQSAGSPYSGVISLFLKRWKAGERPVIYGDGNQLRDFVYVKDIVQANLIAAQRGKGGEVFNVATGRSVSLNRVSHEMNSLFRASLKPRYEAARKGDIRYSRADITALCRLGFKPRYDLRTGLRAFAEPSGMEVGR